MTQFEMLKTLFTEEYRDYGEKDLLRHFSERMDPVYLFSASEACEIKDDGIIEDAEKVMRHDIFGHKFNGPIDWMVLVPFPHYLLAEPCKGLRPDRGREIH